MASSTVTSRRSRTPRVSRCARLAVNHRPRLHGRSKYGLERYTRGALDLLTVVAITQYGRRPSHLLGGFGLIFGLIGIADPALPARRVGPHRQPIGHRPLLQLGILLEMLAVQLVGMGLLAELIIHRTPSADASTRSCAGWDPPSRQVAALDTRSAYVSGMRKARSVADKIGLLDRLDRSGRRRAQYVRSMFAIYDARDLATLDIPWWSTRPSTGSRPSWPTAATGRRVLEFGAGASTAWLAKRCREVHSVEHDIEFAEQIAPLLGGHGNVTVHRCRRAGGNGHRRCGRSGAGTSTWTSPRTSRWSSRSAARST